VVKQKVVSVTVARSVHI